MDVQGNVFKFALKQTDLLQNDVDNVIVDKINLNEKCFQISCFAENFLAIGQSGKLYTWGK